MKSFSLYTGSAVLLLLLWQAVLAMHLVSPAALAYPLEVLHALPSVLSPDGNLPDAGWTLVRSLAAFVIAVPSGVLAGVSVFALGKSSGPGELFLDFLRSIPATALVPVFLIIFGTGNASKIGVGALSAALVISMATLSGLQKRNRTRLAVTKLFRLTRSERVSLVDLPESAPHMFIGFRTGISLALILVVVSEMLIGANRGLGRVIADMQYSDDKGRLYAAIIVVGLIGFLFNHAVRLLERRLLWWRSGE